MIHGENFQQKWWNMTLPMQLANIGSEFSRASKWKEKDTEIFWSTVERFLELVNLSLHDPKLTPSQRKELSRIKEVSLDKFSNAGQYGGSEQSLQNYFDQFALVSRTP